MYTSLEPYQANRVFPCFDQPDLRSTWNLSVNAPAAWQVMHTTRESAVVAEADGRRRWTFPTTPAIATYLFALHAGPYRIWTDRYKDIPLRLWARPSLTKYVRAGEWFGWTKRGLDFYGRYFGHPYPFKKYDQIFVPEAQGAMENVGAVTFGETFLYRSEPTRAQALDSASVLLHEMAHMWFGDLVTMKWWNDLWLNESFATFMAAHALHEATEFKESWPAFFQHSKHRAYLADGYVTTHPIESDGRERKGRLGRLRPNHLRQGRFRFETAARLRRGEELRPGHSPLHQYPPVPKHDVARLHRRAAGRDEERSVELGRSLVTAKRNRPLERQVDLRWFALNRNSIGHGR